MMISQPFPNNAVVEPVFRDRNNYDKNDQNDYGETDMDNNNDLANATNTTREQVMANILSHFNQS